ncbi:SDR family oxidoreductase [Enterovibrio sp. 27052020O]|uniref:SDR family oxidoreductase n=1 Tax=Enterovibrio sp. 27052020O TaxID=3241166 RepID=UPI00388F7A71
MKNILVIGATSSIAYEICKRYSNKGCNLYLLARDMDKLTSIKNDLIVRGANSVQCAQWDASHDRINDDSLDEVVESMGKLDIVLIAHGYLPDQKQCEASSEKTFDAIYANGFSVVRILTKIANVMESQKSGNITVITSVAGDRGRKSNYVYGTSKSMVSTFLQGLSHRLSQKNIHVLDIKPGFVDTPMTEDFKKGILWSSPSVIAKIIERRIERKSSISYAPLFWILIMAIIRALPNRIINKMDI